MSIEHLFDSDRVSTGENPSAIFRYRIFDVDNYSQALVELANESATHIDVYANTEMAGSGWLARSGLNIVEPLDLRSWIGEVSYGAIGTAIIPVYTFDTSPSTMHITRGVRNIYRLVPPRDNKGKIIDGDWVQDENYQGKPQPINWSSEGVAGLDVYAPTLTWSEVYQIPPWQINNAYIKTLRDCSGKVNDSVWRTYGLREVMFLGARGSKLENGYWQIEFSFAYEETKTDIEVDENITIPVKRGWDYLWVQHETAQPLDDEDEPDLELPSKQEIIGVYVDKVHDSFNFGFLGLPV